MLSVCYGTHYKYLKCCFWQQNVNQVWLCKTLVNFIIKAHTNVTTVRSAFRSQFQIRNFSYLPVLPVKKKAKCTFGEIQRFLSWKCSQS